MIERTVYLEITAENAEMPRLSVERWFMPMDGPEESLTKVALVFGERVVLCSAKRALEVCAAITAAASW